MFLTASGNGATSDITIKAGTPILSPILNAECSVLEPDLFHGDDEAELRACAKVTSPWNNEQLITTEWSSGVLASATPRSPAPGSIRLFKTSDVIPPDDRP